MEKALVVGMVGVDRVNCELAESHIYSAHHSCTTKIRSAPSHVCLSRFSVQQATTLEDVSLCEAEECAETMVNYRSICKQEVPGTQAAFDKVR